MIAFQNSYNQRNIIIFMYAQMFNSNKHNCMQGSLGMIVVTTMNFNIDEYRYLAFFEKQLKAP